MDKVRAFSAPGKALLVGGYLVLDPNYKSYVVALSSRMHAVVKQTEGSAEAPLRVKLTSSQFNNDQWEYTVDFESNYELVETKGRRHPFIEKTLANVLNYFQPPRGQLAEISIEVFSDAGYHSQLDSIEHRNEFRSFRFHKKSITDVPKTGLGSSAGLVTVLTAALISVFLPEMDVRLNKHLELIHNLSQVAHCQAQGKVGSGFDVASAVFGSIIYQRFPPALINDLPSIGAPEYADCLRNVIDKADWHSRHDRVSLPKGLRIAMGDVRGGSQTPRLVTQVHQWLQADPEHGSKIYEEINKGNIAFMSGLEELNRIAEQDLSTYNELLQTLENGGSLERFPVLAQIQSAIQQIRKNFRTITSESGADIEPQEQTALLENSLQLKGVLTGMVPGAGGRDAIALIVAEDSNLVEQTKEAVEFGAVTWLDLGQEKFGILEVSPEQYNNLQ
ncbi:AER354Wp [Eremothecium gossypii ATCC 10895]|uniref:Phosphomevalonate kinase n=1 Tax=Eremothecium gossypii (strain ATCC 10895 / CBS 109.51 / FGSC 9923 / NRRL Y-1056) TaxID=284811 RepID=Q756B3_EREGS|nr:AER354Wp [Eremothecium gossypii ATCC 10895]AAS53034.1 AER354Wp [Eremothecium gossypii ATCC 10895]AEY97342.1 FAER354Wp [Eremothecium gossypii FDAG1]